MLYYIHGYLSSPNSTKGTLFKNKLNAKAIEYRDCEPEDLVISDCVKKIEESIRNDPEAKLIGSSLGGLLAAKVALKNENVKAIILLNPAIIPPNYDLTKIKDMPYRILLEMKDKEIFKEKINSKIIILIGNKDEVVPNSWPIEFAKAQEATVKFLNDDHSFTNKINELPAIIENILEEKH